MIRGYIWTQVQTTVHKFWVMWYLGRFCAHLLWRGLKHDMSKYRWDEAEHFAATIFKLRATTYGSDEYKVLLDQIKVALDLHYARNSHHPEFWGSFEYMPITDQIEMVADWSAAVRRHKDGDLAESLLKNSTRFGYDEHKLADLANLAQAMRSLK